MVQVKWTEHARDDLREIFEYIAKDSRYYAQLQVERIESSAFNIGRFPNIGRHLPESLICHIVS